MLSTLWCKLSWSGWGCDLLGLERLEGWQFQTLEGTDMEGSLGSWMKRNHDKLYEFYRIQRIYCIYYQMEIHKWHFWIYYYLSWHIIVYMTYVYIYIYIIHLLHILRSSRKINQLNPKHVSQPGRWFWTFRSRSVLPSKGNGHMLPKNIFFWCHSSGVSWELDIYIYMIIYVHVFIYIHYIHVYIYIYPSWPSVFTIGFPWVIKWDPFWGEANLMQMYGNFEWYPLL